MEKQSHQIIPFISVELQLQSHFILLPIPMPQLLALPDDEIPFPGADGLLIHYLDDFSLLVGLVEDKVASKQLSDYVRSLLPGDVLELGGDVGVEVVDDGENVLEYIDLLGLGNLPWK